MDRSRGESVVKVMQEYIKTIFQRVLGMKALILDEETVFTVGLVVSQTDIIAQQVYFTQNLAKIQDPKRTQEDKCQMDHLKAVLFVRPTDDNIERIRIMLDEAQYREYHLFFTNFLSDTKLQSIADADKHDRVRQVQEVFGDFFATDVNLFHFNLPSTKQLWMPGEVHARHGQSDALSRTMQGLLSVLLAHKIKPEIRYQPTDICKQLALGLNKKMQEEQMLFHFGGGADAREPLLLLLDRREDPVTPLLQQWTYTAMIHELLCIDNNKVDMTGIKDIPDDLRMLVLSSESDDFYAKNQYLDFANVCTNIKEFVNQFSEKRKGVGAGSNAKTVADLKEQFESIPELKRQGLHVSKHMNIVTELNRIVKARKLLEISPVEQELACGSNQGEALKAVMALVDKPDIHFLSKLNVVALYALRYERESPQSIDTLKAVLKTIAEQARQSPDDEKAKQGDKWLAELRFLDELLRHAGARQRLAAGNLYNDGGNPFVKLRKLFRANVEDVESVYTQHKPLLRTILTDLLRGALKPAQFPFATDAPRGAAANVQRLNRFVIVFIIGGCTFEEAYHVQQLNQEFGASKGVRIVLGGSTIHNSTSFRADMLSQFN